jgi:hypothetical protein
MFSVRFFVKQSTLNRLTTDAVTLLSPLTACIASRNVPRHRACVLVCKKCYTDRRSPTVSRYSLLVTVTMDRPRVGAATTNRIRSLYQGLLDFQRHAVSRRSHTLSELGSTSASEQRALTDITNQHDFAVT